MLAKENAYIQSQLYKNSGSVLRRNDRILYYDCTNYYFEIEEESGLRQYGVSKEHRPNPIVEMGLFMDGDSAAGVQHTSGESVGADDAAAAGKRDSAGLWTRTVCGLYRRGAGQSGEPQIQFSQGSAVHHGAVAEEAEGVSERMGAGSARLEGSGRHGVTQAERRGRGYVIQGAVV